MSGYPNDAYGRTITFSSDGITDTYVAGDAITYQFPSGTSQAAVYLSIAIQFNLSQAQSALQTWMDLQYSMDVRWNLNALYILSSQNILLSNRTAYLKQIYTWAQSVVGYAATYIATVQAMTNPAIVAATFPDFTQASVANPNINPFTAIGINN